MRGLTPAPAATPGSCRRRLTRTEIPEARTLQLETAIIERYRRRERCRGREIIGLTEDGKEDFDKLAEVPEAFEGTWAKGRAVVLIRTNAWGW